MTWLLARLRQPSTWRGLIWVLTAGGVTLAPDAWDYIATIGMALAGLIGVLLDDDRPALPPMALQARPEPPALAPVGAAAEQPADELRPLPPSPRVGAVRPPVDRPLGEHYSGWGDR